MAGDQVDDGVAAALVGDVAEIDLGARRQIFRHHVADGAEARRHVVELGLALGGERGELRIGLHAEGGMHGEHDRRTAEIGDVGEVAHGIESRVGVYHRPQHLVGQARDHQGVPVGRGVGHRFRGDHPAGTGPVVDDELLPQRRGQRRREGPAHQVGGPAGGTRHHQADRLGGPVGGVARRQPGNEERRRHGECEELQSVHAKSLVCMSLTPVRCRRKQSEW